MTVLADDVNKALGYEAVVPASDERFVIKKIPTGILSLDRMLAGGIAMGRWTELAGTWSGLKTTILLKVMAQAQRDGYKVAYIDAERTVTKAFFRKHGVSTNPEKLTIVRVRQGEDAVDVMDMLLRSGEYRVIGVDSIAALLPKRQYEKKASEDDMGSAGKLTSAMTRKLTSLNENTAIILINQMRDSIGRFAFGNPEQPPGGRAISFYSSQRINVRRGETVKEKFTNAKGQPRTRVIGRHLVFTLIKDKTGAREDDTCDIYFDVVKKEVDATEDLFSVCLEEKLIIKKGANYWIGKTKVYGKPAILEILRRPKVIAGLTKRVLDASK